MIMLIRRTSASRKRTQLRASKVWNQSTTALTTAHHIDDVADTDRGRDRNTEWVDRLPQAVSPSWDTSTPTRVSPSTVARRPPAGRRVGVQAGRIEALPSAEAPRQRSARSWQAAEALARPA